MAVESEISSTNQVKKNLSELSESIRMVRSVYEHQKSKRDFYAQKVDALKPFIKVFHKVLSHE
jgi:hypothetical protein